MINVEQTTDNQQPSNDVTVSGRDHMVRIMKLVAREHEDECHFTATDVHKDPSEFRFRCFNHKFTENAVVGKVSENIFYNMCRAAIFDRIDFMTRLSKNAEWVVIAWEISSGKGRTRTRMPYSGPRDWDRFKHDPNNYGGGVASPQQTEYKWQEVDHLIFRYTVIDNPQNVELDLMQERNGRKDVTMTKFLETRDFRYLPTPLRKQREESLALLGAYVGGGEAPGDTEVVLTNKQYTQIKALRAAGEAWKDIAPLFRTTWTELRKGYAAAEAQEDQHGSSGVGEA